MMRFKEYDTVTTLFPILNHDGELIPAGTEGVIVDHLKGSKFYTVEFGDYSQETPRIFGEAVVTAGVLKRIEREDASNTLQEVSTLVAD